MVYVSDDCMVKKYTGALEGCIKFNKQVVYYLESNGA